MGRVLRVGLAVVFCLFAEAPGYTQVAAQAVQPVTGFVSAYEIAKIARRAGFQPLAPPLREGTSYVLRATDFRGALMRLVIDARSGAVRDVTHIVPGPGRYGQYVGMPSPYDGTEFDPLSMPPSETTAVSSIHATLPHAVTHSVLPSSPPLPRPRPAALISQHNATTAATAAVPAGAQNKPPAVVEPLND